MKNIQARVMVLVHGTSSECALQMYEELHLVMLQENNLKNTCKRYGSCA